MKISVVIPTYRRTDCLRRCLESLAAQERPAEEIIVVGQGDDLRSREIVSKAAIRSKLTTKWIFVHLDKADFINALNVGVARATSDVVAFIDDDGVAGPRWLTLMEKWYRDPEVGGVGGPYIEHLRGEPVIEYAKEVGKFKWYGRYISRQWCLTEGARWVDVISGGNMSFRRKLIPIISKRLLPYWQANEIFISFGIRRRGFKIIYDPELRIAHFPDERRRYYNFKYKGEDELQQVLFRSNAHNFVYACLVNNPLLKTVPLLLYEFLVGDSGRPGLLRGALLLAEGRRGEFIERFGPAMQGKLLGVRTYLKSRFEGRHNDGR